MESGPQLVVMEQTVDAMINISGNEIREPTQYRNTQNRVWVADDEMDVISQAKTNFMKFLLIT